MEALPLLPQVAENLVTIFYKILRLFSEFNTATNYRESGLIVPMIQVAQVNNIQLEIGTVIGAQKHLRGNPRPACVALGK
jgi:hypothetical protein